MVGDTGEGRAKAHTWPGDWGEDLGWGSMKLGERRLN